MTQNNKILLAIGALLLLFARKGTAAGTSAGMVSYLGQSSLPRGIRNNNPGNIKIGSSDWKGKVPTNQNTDGTFEQFESYPWGVRAMIKLIRDTYMGKWGKTSISEIISTYAPSNENNTQSYVNTVSNKTGFPPDKQLGQDKATIKKLVQAMAEVENGRPAIDDNMFNFSWELL